MTEDYPARREADVVLRDGSTVHIRPVRPEDEARLLAFYRSLSTESRTLRFFTPAVDLERTVRHAAQVDYARRYALVATTGADGQVVGHAEYDAVDAERAEVAFTIGETFQGRGLATIMLGQLAEVAASNGISLFSAEVLPVNHRMLDVFQASGFPVEVRVRPGELLVTFPTSLSDEARDRFEHREQMAAAHALQRFLQPAAVAVIGASRRRGTVGGEIFHNLLDGPFNGPVYPVNRSSAVVQSVPAYPSVAAIPGSVDLAVIAVPAAQVLEAAEACGRKGVRALVVVSAGFAEIGEAGRLRQAELLRICRANGMRLIGPNCIGILNTDPAICLNATFGPRTPPDGNVAFSSQSGALGLAAIEHAASLGLGISSFVSVGNKADISGNDLLNYWETDPRTSVILLYLESFGNPRKFSRIARRVGHQKPIVAVKGGRSPAGQRATSSHTGALLAGSDVTVDALFRQCGVIRTDTLEELFDVATLLANQPVPHGRRVGIVTNAGGPGILCADTCHSQGLVVPLLAEPTQQQLREILPAEASVGNPVDTIATASPEQYGRAVETVAADPNVDTVIAIYIQPIATPTDEVARAVGSAALAIRRQKPLVAAFMGLEGVPPALQAHESRVPCYPFPERAAIAVAQAARYGEWRRRPAAPPAVVEVARRSEAAAVVAQALGRGDGWLHPQEVAALLACYGVPVVEQRIVDSAAAAGSAAADLGGEVVLKAVAPGLVHKTDVGAVRLNLRGAEEVSRVAAEMTNHLQALDRPPTGFVVQRQVPPGVEMVVGVVHDPHFGSLVACGAGGVLVELVRDVSVRLTPLSAQDAAEMPRELKSFPLLQGYRGAPPADIPALEDLLQRIGALADDLPQVAELDCNPVVVHQQGAVVVDARVRVSPVEAPAPLGARR